MSNGDQRSGMRGVLTKLTNISLIVLGFFAVFFSSRSGPQVHNSPSDSHEDMYGTNIAHADIPGGCGAGDGVSGSGSGGCGAAGSSGGDGGSGSGCGCGSDSG